MIFEEYIKKINIDEELLQDLIELYFINCKIDSNRETSGIDIYRNYEYVFPYRWLKDKLNHDSKVLDIGSSSTTWATLIFNEFKCNTYATDIDLKQLEMQKHYLYNIGGIEELDKKFFIECQDATKMTYENSTFDAICSISALEHIPDRGDIDAIHEISRVLKNDGYFIFTAPYSPEFSESVTEHYHHGYEKRYDMNAIENRFSSVKGLKREKLLFINNINDDGDNVSEFWYKYKLYNQLGKISMFFSMLMFNITEEPTEHSRGFIALYRKSTN